MTSTEWQGPIDDESLKIDGYHRTDEFHDVFASLVLLDDILSKVRDNPIYWKWVVLACHSALQGACLCYLTRTDGGGALSEKSEKDLSNFHNLGSQKAITEAAGAKWILGDPEYPKEQVANLPELLKRLPQNLRISLPKEKCSAATDDRTRRICMLHEFRNSFTHFKSVGWSIEIAGLPAIANDAITLVKTLVSHGGYRRYNRFSEIHDLPIVLDSIFSKLEQIEQT